MTTGELELVTRRNCEWLIKAVIVHSMVTATWITVVILELIHAQNPDFAGGLCLLDTEPTQALPGPVVIHGNLMNRELYSGVRIPNKEETS